MFDEMDRLRDEKDLFALLSHYAARDGGPADLAGSFVGDGRRGAAGAGPVSRRTAGIRLGGAEHRPDACAAPRRGAGVLPDHDGRPSRAKQSGPNRRRRREGPRSREKRVTA